MTLSAANTHNVVFGIAFGKQSLPLLVSPPEGGAGYSGNRAPFAAFHKYEKPVTIAHRVNAINPSNTVHTNPFVGSIRSHGAASVNCNSVNRTPAELCSAGFVKGWAA